MKGMNGMQGIGMASPQCDAAHSMSGNGHLRNARRIHGDRSSYVKLPALPARQHAGSLSTHGVIADDHPQITKMSSSRETCANADTARCIGPIRRQGRAGASVIPQRVARLTIELAIAYHDPMATSLPFYIHEDDSPAKREILRAALTLFSERGLAATSIRDIADESGYTNPALYKHFGSKDELALYLFETCHTRVWTACSAALSSGSGFEEKLDAFIGAWLELLDTEPEALAFLADSARVLWPRSSPTLHRKTMIGLARALVAEAPAVQRRSGAVDQDVAAASLQGTLSELGRMIQVGVVPGPARRWRGKLVALFAHLIE